MRAATGNPLFPGQVGWRARRPQGRELRIRIRVVGWRVVDRLDPDHSQGALVQPSIRRDEGRVERRGE
jgi:hypothetical protein